MTVELVVASLADPAPKAALAAGFEEEGVPIVLEDGQKDVEPEALARQAAKRAVLGLGIGGDATRVVLVLAAAPGKPYLEAPAADVREFAQAAARVAARRPLRYR
jgi:hypothetical protein